MLSLLAAVQFLTIIPIKIKRITDKNIADSMIFFPLVGVILGMVLVLLNNFLIFLKFESYSVNVILVVILAVITGGIHLDGLADTADAFLSRKEKDEKLKIMRDSHIGVMGVVSIISIILLKIAFLSSLNSSLKPLAIILMCVLSRWAMVFSMFLFPYARKEGKAKIFIEGINGRIFILATIITLIFMPVVWKLSSFWVIFVIAVLVFIFGKFSRKRIGGITGDTLGSINEISEVIVLLTVCILGRLNCL